MNHQDRAALDIEQLLSVEANEYGADYDAELGAKQARAIARYIGQNYVEASTAALWVSAAREHELMAVMDFVASIPGRLVSPATTAVAQFAGIRASIVLRDRNDVVE